MSHKTLIYKDLNFNNSTEILSYLADTLKENGFVKDGYKEAILVREEEHPTGLPAEVKIAIPHCDHTLVNEAAIAIGILNNTVEFKAMDDPSLGLDVGIVMMLALDEPHGHIEMLQKIIKLIQSPEDLKSISSSENDEETKIIIEKYLG